MQVLESLIRRQVLRGNGDSMKSLFLNKAQIDLLSHIGFKEMTSNQLAIDLDVSIQNASSKLERLRKAGYLTRENVGDPTGGDMYVYECTTVVLNNRR